MALPDRWATWCFGAVLAGFQLLRKQKCDVILSTFPIASAILIGWLLHRVSGKPWIVDFRDSMTEPDYPRDPLTWKVYRWLEKLAVRDAERLIFTASSAVRMYVDRYPALPPDRCSLILNGYDEEDFRDLVVSTGVPKKPIRLVHMGLLYPIERDPRPFFRAVAQLQKDGTLDASQLRIELRASGFESMYGPMIRAEGLENLVHLLPPLPYREALQNAADADGLLLFQAACCDHQIPAKLFEYLRTAKPILAVTSHTGDTAAILKQSGGATIVDSTDWQAIYRVLPEFLKAVEGRSHSRPQSSLVEHYSRKAQAQTLAHLLNDVVIPSGSSS
jgi:glycosyltransferase involved in cell wall biosynthesis